MLRSLRLEQFVIIEEAEISFDSGLNAVTGETGTGKSILIDAIGFLAGGRGETGWLREGAAALAVEGVFDVTRLPAAADAATKLGCPPVRGRLHVRRELVAGGRGRATIEGRGVRVADLRGVGEQLVAIHGQGEHRRLLDPAVQLELIDRYAESSDLRAAYAEARGGWLGALRTLAAARERHAELSDKEDWHRFQLEEIDAADVAPGEEARLRAAREDLAGRRKAIAVRGEIERILFEEDGSALDRIETAQQMIGKGTPGWSEAREEIETARGALRRARRALPPEGTGAEEEDLDGIEGRLALLSRLKKKYGGTEEAILARRDRLSEALQETEALGNAIAGLIGEVESARAAAAVAAARLRQARRKVAPALGRAITAELRALGMAGALLDVVMESEAVEDGESLEIEGQRVRGFEDGCDRVWLRLRPNPGEGAGPLAAVASGGELSRSLLAILAVLGTREEPRTAIFDEVDAGVGGATAAAVARRLESLARDRQVLLVTHLPLVACRARRHFRVGKGERGGRTHAEIAALDRNERIGELARMLAGEVDSAIARKHAQALMEAAAAGKEIG